MELSDLLKKDFLGKDSFSDDKYIATEMLTGAKMAALSYFTAAIESATPELKNFYMTYCNQLFQAHAELSDLCIKRGWFSAYGDSKDQLKEALKDSYKVLSTKA